MDIFVPRALNLRIGLALLLGLVPSLAFAQATSRMCEGQAGEAPGPACLVAHEEVGTLPSGPLFWNIYTFADTESAQRVAPPNAAVVAAFGKVWLFSVGGKGAALEGGQHLSDVGPMPINPAEGDYSVEYLKSTFAPGQTAPVHVHSGPEAFYAVSGGSCLETPDGVQVARGAGHSLMIKQGPPMLLMATGTEPRQGFALILHGMGRPPTTLTPDWVPKGLCTKDMPMGKTES